MLRKVLNRISTLLEWSLAAGRPSGFGYWVGAVVFLFVLAGSWLCSSPVAAQRPAISGGEKASEGVVSLSVELGDGRQQITVIDPRQRTMAVYQIDPRTGAITLKSVRNFHWDLQMDEFNSGGNPSPKEIRALLEQR